MKLLKRERLDSHLSIIMPIIKRQMAKMCAEDIVAVQPLIGPNGTWFKFKEGRYETGKESNGQYTISED